ncbi:hypothetical protein, partial [Pseudomonas aeruginosa]
MSKKSRSRLWFLVHSWLALPIWFFVLLVEAQAGELGGAEG